MTEFMSDALVISILQIIAIDIILGGDNAIIIALACRDLPEHQKKMGILWGTAGAIILRVILVFFATTLLTVPGLKLIGGLLLLWIGIKLLIENGGETDHKVNSSQGLMTAIRTIVIADFVMSLDNSIAIAAAAKGNMYLVVFGLLLSVPIIIAGSALILKLMSRFPIIISLGAGLLGWLAGDLIVHDPLLENFLTSHLPYADLVMAGGLAGVVILVGQTLASRQKAI
ncbi:TerC family protein [Alphaproteobacteria bacterium]|jgi:YjbE family integral membrane protein|nr:TerC family protein [Alphaproteobacteria bacterium]